MVKQKENLIQFYDKEEESAKRVRTQDTIIQRGNDKLAQWINEFEKAIKQINAGLL
jgi:uncharacterized FlaG/YvyC family protein